MTAEILLESVVQVGGVLKLDGDSVRCLLPKTVAHLAGELKERKPELIEVLKARGGHAANFPRCPRCGSYALFRDGNVGNYECLTCTLQDITEADARRAGAEEQCSGRVM
jgi:hypothetical protein